MTQKAPTGGPPQGPAVEPEEATPAAREDSPEVTSPPREVGGRDGPEPTRFGDWEKNGRCIDF
ncbi:MAG: DUF1674 domain-containing protein [Pseudomonadota bacterium]